MCRSLRAVIRSADFLPACTGCVNGAHAGKYAVRGVNRHHISYSPSPLPQGIRSEVSTAPQLVRTGVLLRLRIRPPKA